MKKSRLAKAGYDNAKSLLDIVREIGETAVSLWWRFFDWLAQVEWRKLMMIWLLLLIFGLTPFGLPKQTGAFILLSFGLKVLAGGKRKAEIEARHATSHADEEGMERRLMEAQMAALQAQVEPHFLFNTLALIGQLIETDPPEAARIHEPDRLPARDLPQMRAGRRHAGPAGRAVARLPGHHAGAHEGAAGGALRRARLPRQRALPADDAADPDRERHQARPGTEDQGGRIDIRASVDGQTLQVDVLDDGIGFNIRAGRRHRPGQHPRTPAHAVRQPRAAGDRGTADGRRLARAIKLPDTDDARPASAAPPR
jgi:hypothetical protein